MKCYISRVIRLGMIVWLAALLLIAGVASPLYAATGQVQVIDIQGVINPLSARYLERTLAAADQSGATLVVLRLDTPGGLDTAMRDMTQALLAARTPVVVYVTPSGARAASAGLFIALAAPVAAMAPGTNIGAAHPVALGGQTQTDDVMASKVAQDAAATARALAVERGRNPDWAEKAVLESLSYTAAEALEYGLIDLLADDLPALLAKLDGRTIETAAGTVTLQTRDVTIIETPMNFAEQLLHLITDPNIAFLLLTLGLYGLIIEFQAPGFGLAGGVGVIALALAFVAFGNLPLNWAGVGLIGLGAILLAAEAFSPGFGAMGIAGLAMFTLGALMLYRPFTPTAPMLPVVSVSPWLLATITAMTAALLLLVVRMGLKAQRLFPISDVAHRLTGATGTAVTDLTPTGTAQIESELWTAVVDGDQAIRAGDKVVVTALHGITVRVRPVSTTLPLNQPPNQPSNQQETNHV